MKKELKEKVQNFFKEYSDISLVYKEFEGLVYRDTLKRWCYPEAGEEARLRAKAYHQKNKDNPEYKEKQRLRAEKKRKTPEYQEFRRSYYEKNKEKIQEMVKNHRHENLDHYLQKAHQHYQNNKGRYKQWSKEYRLKNKDHLQSLELKSNQESLEGSGVPLELKYTFKELEQEKNFYTFAEGNYGIIPPKNKIVLNFQPHFYETERQLWRQKNIQEKILQNRSRYLNKSIDQLTSAEILRGFKISGIHYGFSHFSALWFKKFLVDYSIESVYDPCGGWGHRVLGLLGTSVKKYIYNDFDSRTVYGVQQIVNFLNLNSIIEIHNQKSQYWSPSSSVQCIFTCPPYFNKETYNHKIFKNLEDYSFWWNQVVEQSLKLNPNYFGVVIDSDHLDLKNYSLSNHSLILEQKLKKNSSHLSKKSSSYETLLVFSL